MRNDKLAAELVLTLFHARTAAHILHLGTKSYAQHVALDELYKALPDLADAIAEAYQGAFGVLLDFPDGGFKLPKGDALAFVVALRTWVDDRRARVTDRPEIQNLIDELVDQLDSTAYKLKFLG